MSTTMTATPPVDPRHLRRVARALDAALWLVALAVGVYSLANVHAVAVGHGTGDPQAWLLAPIVDVALFGGITADSVLSRYGVKPSGWGTALRWFCGGATWTLNVWDAAASGDLGAIVTHSVPPVVLILLAEAAPRYRQQFATLAHNAPAAPAVPASDTPRVAPAGHPATHPDSPVVATPDAGRSSTPDLPEHPPASHPVRTAPTTPKPRADKGTRVPRAARTKQAPTRTDDELLTAIDALGDAVDAQSIRRTAADLGIGETRTKRLLQVHAARRTPGLSVVQDAEVAS